MKHRGQVGIEVVVLVAAIFIIIAMIFGNYFSINDSTIAMVVLKSNTLGRISDLNESYVLISIDFVETAPTDIAIDVVTIPTISNSEIDPDNTWIDEVEQKIIDKTKYTNVTIDFNPP